MIQIGLKTAFNFFVSYFFYLSQECRSRLYHNVSSIWDGGVDGPESHLISHEVDVGGPSPAVGKCVVVSGSTQAALEQHAARAEMVLNLERKTHRSITLVIYCQTATVSIAAGLLPGCCSGVCCSRVTRCKPHGLFLPRGGATDAARSSALLWNPPWFCTPARACPYSSRPSTRPEGGK